MKLAAFALLVATVSANADPLLTVVGHGSVSGAETEARLNVTAESRGATTADAMAAQRNAMANLTKALAKAGVPQKDFAVTNLNLNPQYGPGNTLPGQQRVITGYLCSTIVTVSVEQSDHLGEVLQALAEAGASQQAHVNYVAHATEAQQAESRAAAVKDAFARGQLLAKQTGVSLGRVVAVSDGATPGAVNYTDILQAIGNNGVNRTVNAAVTVSWEIKSP